jgi:hypothetical protein
MKHLTLFACALIAAPTLAFAAEHRQEFPYPKAEVYRALIETLPTVGFKIKAQDPVIARVTASDGVSWTSMGENLSIAVVTIDQANSAIEFNGATKAREPIFFQGKNQKNFDKVVLAVSRRLQASGLAAGAQ